MSPHPLAATLQSVSNLRTAPPRGLQWWVSLQSHQADVVLGHPEGARAGACVSSWIIGILLLGTVLFCSFESGETERRQMSLLSSSRARSEIWDTTGWFSSPLSLGMSWRK